MRCENAVIFARFVLITLLPVLSATVTGCSADLRCREYCPVCMDPQLDGEDRELEYRATLEFPSGEATLEGVLYQAPGAGPHPTAIYLHGYPGGPSGFDLAMAIRRAGWNVLMFHYRGTWPPPSAN